MDCARWMPRKFLCTFICSTQVHTEINLLMQAHICVKYNTHEKLLLMWTWLNNNISYKFISRKQKCTIEYMGLGKTTAQVSVTSSSPWRPGFSLMPVHVGFVVHNVAVGQVSLQALQFSPVHMIQPIPHTHSFTHDWSYTGLAIDSISK